MTGVMVHCPRDGIQELEGFMDISYGDVTIIGSRMSCPVCGGMADIVDGHYQGKGRAEPATAQLWPTPVQQRAFLKVTPQQARRLKNVYDWAVNAREQGTASDERIVERVEDALRQVPGGEKVIDRVLNNRNMKIVAVAGLLLTILFFLIEQFGASGVELTDEQFEQLLDAATSQSEVVEDTDAERSSNTGTGIPRELGTTSSDPEDGVPRPGS